MRVRGGGTVLGAAADLVQRRAVRRCVAVAGVDVAAFSPSADSGGVWKDDRARAAGQCLLLRRVSGRVLPAACGIERWTAAAPVGRLDSGDAVGPAGGELLDRG